MQASSSTNSMCNIQIAFFTDPPVSTSFHVDIYQCLLQIFGDGQFIKKWSYSPYHHLIGKNVH